MAAEDRSFSPLVKVDGQSLTDLLHGLTATIETLQERGFDPTQFTFDQLVFRHGSTPNGPGIVLGLNLEELDYESLPVVYEGEALGQRFSVSYGENPLDHWMFITLDDQRRTHTGGGGSGGSSGSSSHVGDLIDGLRGVMLRFPRSNARNVTRVHIQRPGSEQGEELQVFDVGSDSGMACIATLVDEQGGTLEFLDPEGGSSGPGRPEGSRPHGIAYGRLA